MSPYRWHSTPISSDAASLAPWSELYRAHGATPLLHTDFLQAALRAFGKAGTRLYTCFENGETVAACVAHPLDAIRVTTFQPSQAPIGFWLQRRDAPIESLMRSLSRAHAPWVLSLAITQQDPDLLTRPTQSGNLLSADYIDTARISIATDWDTYWRGRGANLRHNIKRAKAKLTAANRHVELRTITAKEEMAEAVRGYGEIESKSWKASEGTAVSPENEQGRFYTHLLELFADREKARCYQLLIDGKIAATDLCVCGDAEIVILKTTYDAQFAEYSPASLMREMAFARLFAEPWCDRIEFYGRVMDWHLRWTNEVRRMFHVTWFRYPGALKLWQVSRRLRRARGEIETRVAQPQDSSAATRRAHSTAKNHTPEPERG